ncbi:MAG: hypothetical protein ACHREM_16350 [Polyangiales bacterium]
MAMWARARLAVLTVFAVVPAVSRLFWATQFDEAALSDPLSGVAILLYHAPIVAFAALACGTLGGTILRSAGWMMAAVAFCFIEAFGEMLLNRD